jgi:hypothetical protein
VPGGSAPAPADRPEAPGQLDGIAAGPAAAAPPAHEAVPLAAPVRIQGIVAMIVLGLFVVLIAGSLVMYFVVLRPWEAAGPGGAPPPAPEGTTTGPGEVTEPDRPVGPVAPKNPFTLPGPQVAGMKIAPPVVYVVDASWSMSEYYDPAGAIVRHSVRGLGAQKFNVIVISEDGPKALTDGWAIAPAGDAEAKTLFRSHQPAGATDLGPALRQAIQAGPKTVVLLAAKAPEDAGAIAELAKSRGISIFTVSLGDYPDATTGLKALAGATQGDCRAFGLDALVEDLQAAPLLP